MIYKSTYRIKRKYFIMLMKLERSSSQRIIALHDLQSTFAYTINKILLIYLLLLRNNIPKKLEPRKLLHPRTISPHRKSSSKHDGRNEGNDATDSILQQEFFNKRNVS